MSSAGPVRERAEGAAAPAFLDSVHEALARLKSAAGVPGQDAMAFELAVVEVVGNSVEHAEPVDPGFPLRPALELEASDSVLRARLQEFGARTPVLPQGVAEMPGWQAESGRGLAIAARLLDSLERGTGPHG